MTCALLLCSALQMTLASEPHSTWVDRHDNYTDWAIYRGDKKANQYSTLAQINSTNVHQLEVAWEYHHGDPAAPSMYSNPIMVDGLLYFTTPKVHAVALDAVTGREVWRFDPAPHNPKDRNFRGRNRGVVYWENSERKNGRIFNFVKDRVYALDAKTGALITNFGEGGWIDLRKNLSIDPAKASIEVTTPGIVYRHLLIVGSRVPEEHNSTPGDIRAYNAETGAFEWIFHTVPQKGEVGYDTWQFEEGEIYGGANPWGGFSLDEKRGWVFCATGSAAGDFIYGGTRKGINLFANCVLALDALTGERKWHYQTVHHDIFDYDNPPAPILATITVDGKQRDVAVQLTKMGLTFVLDRDTGEPIFPVEERPVPASRVPGEQAWHTQPFPTRPPPLVRLVTFESDLTQITPESHAAALKKFREVDTGYLYTPASLRGTMTTPGHQGGVEWGGGAFDPATGVLYVNANEAPTINQLKPLAEIDPAKATPVERGAMLYNLACTACHGLNRQGNPPLYPPLHNVRERLKTHDIRAVLLSGRGVMPSFATLATNEMNDLVAYLESDAEETEAAVTGPTRRYAQIAPFFEDPYGVPAISPPWGTLNAVDLNKGEILWKVPLGEYPQLVAKGIRNTGAKNFGGPILTAGGVIFIAATPDEKIRAFDKYTGKVLWEHKLPAGGYATPSTYEIDGRQFLVIAAGGGGKLGTRHGDSIIAFALPDSAAAQTKNADAAIQLERSEGKLLVRARVPGTDDWANLATYVAQPGERPYLHPVRDASGRQVLTADRPADHPWQHGIFTGFHRVNGFNYWKEDQGRQRLVRISDIKEQPQSVSWKSLVELVSPEGEVVLEEENIITVHAPEATNLYTIDFTLVLRAKNKDVQFGKFFVGGLSVRMPWDEQNPGQKHLNSEGQRGRAAEQQRAAWCTVEQPFDGEVFGIAILDHPKNANHPPSWRVDEQGLINPNVSGLRDWSLRAGESAQFNYRVVIFRGPSDPELMKRQYSTFAP